MCLLRGLAVGAEAVDVEPVADDPKAGALRYVTGERRGEVGLPVHDLAAAEADQVRVRVLYSCVVLASDSSALPTPEKRKLK